VGDTPGPLGINDHADPGRQIHKKKSRPDARFPTFLAISDLGVKFIWKEEYVDGISERLHWPRGSSGVTLGAGYDMKERTKQQVAADLRSIGVCMSDSEKVAEGAGLEGQAANGFVKRQRKTLVLSEMQALKLLKLILPSYESIVRHLVKVPLLQNEYDALVSFAYNPGGRFNRVARCINNRRIREAMEHVTAANTSGGEVAKGLVARRKREVELFLKGRYVQ
jgi:GH24 family phage-related lysozyme (muramidase)